MASQDGAVLKATAKGQEKQCRAVDCLAPSELGPALQVLGLQASAEEVEALTCWLAGLDCKGTYRLADLVQAVDAAASRARGK